MQLRFTLLTNALSLALTLPILQAQASDVPPPLITSVAGLPKAPVDEYQFDASFYTDDFTTNTGPASRINATEALWDWELALKHVAGNAGSDASDSVPDDANSAQVPIAVDVEGVDGAHEAVGAVREEWKNQVLRWHNGHRANYGAAPLTWSDELHKVALESAEACQLRPKEAENLAAGTEDFGLAKAMKMWMDEANIYDYNRPEFSRGTGHFTQLVWKQTKEVACVQTTCKAGTIFQDDPSTFVVCRYNPPGNYAGYFPHNVGFHQG
ncbi:hypothetical protein AX16_008972 [Volvariella volvacea WC 439]|nr:hypothetical protein AX16_008972 [Volvariella volvacea WC 439]